MEEQVGALWHRLISRLAETRYPEAAVRLADVERGVGVMFRALGGDPGLQVTSADAVEHGARRTWLQRIAGSNRKVSLAWRDDEYLRLPAQIDWLPERALNRELYLWLAALAVAAPDCPGSWFDANQRRTRQTLARFPGLRGRYRRLVDAHLACRPATDSLPPDEAAAEQAIRQALLDPGSLAELPAARRAPAPVPLWLHPQPPVPASGSAPAAPDNGDPDSGSETRELEHTRRPAERIKPPEKDRGLITVRMENIFSWGEFVNVDRGKEDEDDLDRAESVARDLDRLAVSRDARSASAKLKFDLDLPSEVEDDLVIDDGLLLPEWDYRRRELIADHCRVVQMISDRAESLPLPPRIARTARRLRDQFQALAPARQWHRAQQDGQEVDIDAYLRFATDRHVGHGAGSDRLYREMRAGSRDLACLLLADLSLSTDTWIDDYHRVIDVIRDSLYLFAEALNETGDQYAMYGFSSRKRDPVRIHTLKSFEQAYGGQVRGRIEVIKPGYYTRMGAAIRYGTMSLSDQAGGRRLLLLLSDGKPNDLDQYEGRYGIEDTRQAINAARQLGIQPFCVTIDNRGNDYLPYLFGSNGYVVIRRPAELPHRLPLLYAQLTS